MYPVQLSINSLDRTETYGPGDLRYFVPGPSEDREDSGWAIIVAPVSPDDLTAPGEAGYGSLRVLTAYGARVVSSVVMGVLIEQTH